MLKEGVLPPWLIKILDTHPYIPLTSLYIPLMLNHKTVKGGVKEKSHKFLKIYLGVEKIYLRNVGENINPPPPHLPKYTYIDLPKAHFPFTPSSDLV